MPFALAIIGALLMVTSIRGTSSNLFKLVAGDIGSATYLNWAIVIFVVGGAGYIKSLQKVSVMFMGLIILVLLIVNRGFFTQFMAAVQAGSGACSLAPSDLGLSSPTAGAQAASQNDQQNMNTLLGNLGLPGLNYGQNWSIPQAASQTGIGLNNSALGMPSLGGGMGAGY